jgi:hypothetical protein
MIRKISLAELLVALLGLSAVFSLIFCYQATRTLGHVQTLHTAGVGLQSQLSLIQRNRTIIQSMAEDAIEYSKRNPAIDPILQQHNVKPKPAAPAPTPAKPASR